ncbi:Na+/melibiose symporter [Saccharopolyspora antimicrobica]|uniref:Na+/melibiose symporter n=1 Tax=Saccharopolyspora antimicrobica TaxID=455193 RepID=A0A1I5JWI2_9PSEU|nr:MFS transporter [Saccharopolyspora antimicrobica]RKT86974.1 Na+/melibiose symporter-like transporter [Saccharopolyspora antimicrobica]SFO77118.1 Na+/melibiose symporter [Saccharopolyspora antimicrobica]
MPAADAAEHLSAPERAKEARRVVLSSYLGSTLEYYDFLLYGTAASLVFGPVFFSDLPPAVGTIASLGTFAAGYLARPFGGVLFGHFGDRAGRKAMLVLAMTVMGTASVLIGLVPPASMIGPWAAIILVTLRVLQGIAIGGEWGGAALMALEHAEPRKRGYLAAFTNAGAPTGAVLGTLVMTLFALLPEDEFMRWGWRIPFLLSAVMLAIGLFVRAKVSESPIFQAAAEQADADRTEKKDAPPIIEVLRRPKVVMLAAFACLAGFALQTAFTTFGITYAVEHGTPRPDALLGYAIGQFFAIFFILGYARLSDRLGRRPVMLFGLAAMIVLVYPMLHMLTTGDLALVSLAFILYTFCHGATYGPMAAYIAEQFGTRTRYTGASLGYQIATLLGGGFTPVILASLYASSGSSIIPVGGFIIALGILSGIVLLCTRETKDNDLTAV